MAGSSSKEALVYFAGELQYYPRIRLCEQSTVQPRSRTGVRVDRSRVLAARTQAPISFPNVELPSSDHLWTEAMTWTCQQWLVFCWRRPHKIQESVVFLCL